LSDAIFKSENKGPLKSVWASFIHRLENRVSQDGRRMEHVILNKLHKWRLPSGTRKNLQINF